MPGSGRDRREKQAARFARWLPTLERLTAKRIIPDLEAFIAAEARDERLRHTGRKPRSLADEFRALLNGNLERIETGWKAAGRFDHLLATARTIVGVRGFARQPSHRDAPAHPSTITAAPAPHKEEAMAPTQKQFEQLFRFPIMPSEARRLLDHVFADEAIPSKIVRARSNLGSMLYDALKLGGYLKPVGKHGMNTPAVVDADMFRHTRFMLAREGLKQFKRSNKRPSELAKSEQQMFPEDQFLRDLKTIAGRKVEPVVQVPETPVTAPVPVSAPIAAPPPSTDWLAAHCKDLERQLEEARATRAKLTSELEDLDARRAHLSRKLGAAEARVDLLAAELVALSRPTSA